MGTKRIRYIASRRLTVHVCGTVVESLVGLSPSYGHFRVLCKACMCGCNKIFSSQSESCTSQSTHSESVLQFTLILALLLKDTDLFVGSTELSLLVFCLFCDPC